MPAAVVYGVALAATAAVSAYSAYEQSQAQNKIFEANQNSAIRSALDQYEAQGAAANQRRDAAGQAAEKNARDAARARATVNAASEGSNIAGLSIDALQNEITAQEGTNYTNIAANEAYAQDQQVRQGRGITAQAQDRINSVQPGNFNPVVGLLQIGAAGVGGYASMGGDFGYGNTPKKS